MSHLIMRQNILVFCFQIRSYSIKNLMLLSNFIFFEVSYTRLLEQEAKFKTERTRLKEESTKLANQVGIIVKYFFFQLFSGICFIFIGSWLKFPFWIISLNTQTLTLMNNFFFSKEILRMIEYLKCGIFLPIDSTSKRFFFLEKLLLGLKSKIQSECA